MLIFHTPHRRWLTSKSWKPQPIAAPPLPAMCAMCLVHVNKDCSSWRPLFCLCMEILLDFNIFIKVRDYPVLTLYFSGRKHLVIHIHYVFPDMERTVRSLDHVINYYMVSRELADLIQAGPNTSTTDSLNVYLEVREVFNFLGLFVKSSCHIIASNRLNINYFTGNWNPTITYYTGHRPHYSPPTSVILLCKCEQYYFNYIWRFYCITSWLSIAPSMYFVYIRWKL